MATKDYTEHDTDGSKDSDYLEEFQIPRIHVRPIQGTRLYTVEELMNERDSYKKANEQLGAQIFTLNRRVLASEAKFWRERKLLESKTVELTKKNNNLQEAKVNFENMRTDNMALFGKIEEYQKTIKDLKTNEKKLETKLKAFKKKSIESESRKTEDNQKELRDLKQRLRDLDTELNEKNEIIAKKITEESKVNNKLDDMKGILCQMANSIKEGKKKEAIMAHKLDNVEQKVNDILAAVKGANIEGTSANNPGKQQTEMDRPTEMAPTLPPIKKRQDKKRWQPNGL